MATELLINAGAGETRVALLRDGRLEEYSTAQSIFFETQVGDIWYGRVKKVVPGMQAAFVDIGQRQDGFLSLSDARVLSRKEEPTISDCVREGEALALQISKPPAGGKGARLSADLALPGRLLVLTPLRQNISISRTIAAGPRQALQATGKQVREAIGGSCGFILRTQASDAGLDALIDEARRLAAIWAEIQRTRGHVEPVSLLYSSPNLLRRALRDLSADIVRIDDATAMTWARDFCASMAPEVESRLVYAPPPLFDESLEDDIAGLATSRTALSSGGWITIEVTEALTAIDVNSGGLAGSGSVDETALTTNLEAARAAGRQLRLRGIGGLIVIDFLQMQDATARARVVETLRQALADGSTPFDITPMAEAGIVAVTRKRSGEMLSRQYTEPCATCHGTGRTPSGLRRLLDLVGAAEREARANPGREILVHADLAVMEWMKVWGSMVRANLRRRGAVRVRFEEAEKNDVVAL